MKPRRVALLGLLTGIALTIFMVENQIPMVVPGMKIGLSNIVTVFTVFVLGPGEAGAMLASRIFLGAVFGGNFSTIFYSGAGGLCAILVTIALRKVLTMKQIWAAGVMGAIAHTIGQMIVAVLIAGVPVLVYLPVLIIASVFTGLFTGLCAQFLINHGGNLWKTFLK